MGKVYYIFLKPDTTLYYYIIADFRVYVWYLIHTFRQKIQLQYIVWRYCLLPEPVDWSKRVLVVGQYYCRLALKYNYAADFDRFELFDVFKLIMLLFSKLVHTKMYLYII